MPEKSHGDFLRGLFGATCARVVLTIHRMGEATTKELADQLRITPNAVRRHLKRLAKMKLLEQRPAPRPLGRPAYRFRLSPKAESILPSALPDVAILLSQLVLADKNAEGRHGLARWVMNRLLMENEGAEEEEARADPNGTRGSLDRTVLIERLERMGFMPRETDGGRGLCLQHCPFGELAQTFPELCEAEREYIRQCLGSSVQRVAWRLGKTSACAYQVPPRR